MIEQVVMNLVINARDAMAAGGPIEIRTDLTLLDDAAAASIQNGAPGPYARLTVTDAGCGMSPAVLQRIFEPFFTTKPAGKGTGLGLATVFGIVRQHEGWIRVESVEGKGTTFTIGLPNIPAPVSSGAETALEGPPVKGHESILIAEDNEHVRIIAAHILRTAGYRVTEAADGVVARELLEAKSRRIDLLLTDLEMPGGVSGLDLAAIGARGVGIRTILMSANAAGFDVAAWESAGGRFLNKPFNTDRLLRAVRTALDQPS